MLKVSVNPKLSTTTTKNRAALIVTVEAVLVFISCVTWCLQCFDAVGWVAGRASDL